MSLKRNGINSIILFKYPLIYFSIPSLTYKCYGLSIYYYSRTWYRTVNIMLFSYVSLSITQSLSMTSNHMLMQKLLMPSNG